MKDIQSLLNSLRRPGLLIRAARHGAAEYRRDVHLPRHLGYRKLPRSGPALVRLMEIEEDMNTRRRAGDASYSLERHVDVLIALMGEAHLFQAAQSRA